MEKVSQPEGEIFAVAEFHQSPKVPEKLQREFLQQELRKRMDEFNKQTDDAHYSSVMRSSAIVQIYDFFLMYSEDLSDMSMYRLQTATNEAFSEIDNIRAEALETAENMLVTKAIELIEAVVST